MRVLVTSSRSWDRPDVVWSCLDIVAREAFEAGDEKVTVVHGACPTGGDQHADAWGRLTRQRPAWPFEAWSIQVERHPADWQTHGRRAGFVRNQHMVSLGADLVLGFLRGDSRGTGHCLELAERAGLTVRVLRYEDLPSPSEPAPSEGASQ